MRGHLRVTLGSAWQEPGSISKADCRGGGNSPHPGQSPCDRREHRAGSGAPLAPRAGSTELAPRGALLSLLPRPWRVRDASAESAGSFRDGKSIVRKRIRAVCFFVRWKGNKQTKKKTFLEENEKPKHKHSAQDRFLDHPARRAAGQRPGRSGEEGSV